MNITLVGCGLEIDCAPEQQEEKRDQTYIRSSDQNVILLVVINSTLSKSVKYTEDAVRAKFQTGGGILGED